MDELDELGIPSEKLYAEQALFYFGTVMTVGSTSCKVKLDSVPGTPAIACSKSSSLSVSTNNRVLIISISGTHFILAKIT